MDNSLTWCAPEQRTSPSGHMEVNLSAPTSSHSYVDSGLASTPGCGLDVATSQQTQYQIDQDTQYTHECPSSHNSDHTEHNKTKGDCQLNQLHESCSHAHTSHSNPTHTSGNDIKEMHEQVHTMLTSVIHDVMLNTSDSTNVSHPGSSHLSGMNVNETQPSAGDAGLPSSHQSEGNACSDDSEVMPSPFSVVACGILFSAYRSTFTVAELVLVLIIKDASF